MVVAELVSLGPVEQYRPRRGVYGISLGSGSGHLIICLAVTGRRARWSCTVGVMGERRGWVSERGGDSQADTEEEDGDIDALPSPTASEKLLYADEQRVDSVTFHLPTPPPSSLPALLCRYSQRVHDAHVPRWTRDPSCIMVVLSDAQWRTNTPGLLVLSAQGRTLGNKRRLPVKESGRGGCNTHLLHSLPPPRPGFVVSDHWRRDPRAFTPPPRRVCFHVDN